MMSPQDPNAADLYTATGNNCRLKLITSYMVSALTKFTQPIFVRREDPNSRQHAIQEIQRRAQSKGKWPQILIFPEGTCTNGTALISFKPGVTLVLGNCVLTIAFEWYATYRHGNFCPRL